MVEVAGGGVLRGHLGLIERAAAAGLDFGATRGGASSDGFADGARAAAARKAAARLLGLLPAAAPPVKPKPQQQSQHGGGVGGEEDDAADGPSSPAASGNLLEPWSRRVGGLVLAAADTVAQVR
jgi:hypothetical protein